MSIQLQLTINFLDNLMYLKNVGVTGAEDNR